MVAMTDIGTMFSLAGKTALITGASAGLGERMAITLARAGARTAIVARRRELLEKVAQQAPGMVVMPADLADAAEVSRLAAEALRELGHVDILVNNAAYIAGGVKAENETLEQIRTTLAVNLEAPILLAQAFVPGMRARGGGSIVNVSSIVASVGIGRFPQAVYAASKGGIEAITREWAAQWSRDNIRVNSLAPGFIESEMTAPVIHQEKVQKWILKNTLLPRHGVAADFDGALLFLASDASAYVTGQTIRVDGGWTAH
jgi:NAD(P)-dependent dehydrogenase (short-subunit alcohol dehydrogenase family)